MTEAMREKPCRMCGDMMPMPPSSRRVYCLDCVRLRANAKTRRLRAKRSENIDPDAAWHGTTQGYANYACRCEPCRVADRDYNTMWRRRPAVAERIREQARINSKKPENRLKRKARQYGLDPIQLGGFLADRICFACDARDVDLVVDHDHACCSDGKSCGDCVRGLLCMGCNTALGVVADNRERLVSLISYLDRWDSKRG